MSFDLDMAKYLDAQRRKPPPAGFYIGTVVSLTPLTISILDGEILATGVFLMLSETISRLLAPLPDCVFNGCACGGNCKHQCFPQPLKVGENVILIGQKRFIAIDRLGGA